MAWKSDELYDYQEDIKEKRSINRSARNRRGHTGKGGAVKFSTDYLTEKQLRALDGECKTYRLGSPMNWDEFKSMPTDLQVMYIKKLRKQFNVPDEELATAMGVDISVFTERLGKLKLSQRIGSREWYDTDSHGRFVTWWVIAKEE